MMPKEFVIPTNTEIIFVADLFVSDYIGGAELTTEAIISYGNKKIFRLHSESLTPDIVELNKDKYWILCNWGSSPLEGRIQLVQSNCKYSVIEYDYKYCKYRSSHLHYLATKEQCNCHLEKHGKWVAAFYKRAEHVFFMSSGQMNEYLKFFPQLKDNSKILSSVWTKQDLEKFQVLKNTRNANNKWAILKGGSWIKAQQQTETYAGINNIDYQLIGNLPYEEFLEKLSEYKGLIFHPAGFDTCPRLVIEAKLMGLELDLNENVQHREEQWFSSENISDTISYLEDSYSRFWKIINKE